MSCGWEINTGISAFELNQTLISKDASHFCLYSALFEQLFFSFLSLGGEAEAWTWGQTLSRIALEVGQLVTWMQSKFTATVAATAWIIIKFVLKSDG